VVRPPGLIIGDTEEISEEATKTMVEILVATVLSGMATAILGVTREGLDIVATAAEIGTPADGIVVVGEETAAVGETVDGAERLAGDAVFGRP
jgi:uncharacterized membrane-anchored protein